MVETLILMVIQMVQFYKNIDIDIDKKNYEN